MILSFDDYHEDNFKLAELAKEYGFKPIFFIDFRPEYYEEATEQVKMLSKMGFEIGGHTINHTHLTSVSRELAEWEINESKKLIEELTGKPCEWFCLPRGRGNDDIYKIIFNAGFNYIRTTKLYDDQEDNRIKGGCHLTYPRTEYNGIDPFEWAKQSKLDHYWGHMFEVKKFSLWGKMEDFFAWYKKNRT